MKPESEAWRQLQDEAAMNLRPGFADRVLRAARVIAGPSPLSQFAFSAATAALCLMAIALFQARLGQSDQTRAFADWQKVASAASEIPAQ